MPISQRICSEEVNTEIDLYWQVVLGSLLLTACNVALYTLLFRHKFQGAPGLASQFFFVTGSVKVVLGVLITLLFTPSCPLHCSCDLMELPSPVYGLVCSLVGLGWIGRGIRAWQKAQLLERGDSEGGKDTVFEQLPTSDDDNNDNSQVDMVAIKQSNAKESQVEAASE